VQDVYKERLRMRGVECGNALVGEGCEVCFNEVVEFVGEERKIIVEVSEVLCA
jgi:hypothetical protein